MEDIASRLAAAGETLAVDALTARVFRALSAAGLQCRLLKGASFSWLYDHDRPRTYGDCDFLLPPADLKPAEAVLQGMDFSPSALNFEKGDRPWYHTSWVDPGTKVVVELHRTLIGATASHEVVWSVLSQPTETVLVAGESVDALSIPGRALHVGLHAAQHGAHLRSREDLVRALERVPASDWEAAARLARRIGAEHALSLGLRYEPSGARLASRLGLPEDAPTEMRLRAAGPPDLALGFDWLASRRGLAAKAALIGSKLFPPPAFLREWVPLRRGRPLPLPLAYLWRIAWLLRRAPAGYRAWRTTKRGEAQKPG